jgi:hypothetical protein
MGERVGVRGTGKVLNALAAFAAPLTPTLSPLWVEREFDRSPTKTCRAEAAKRLK